jgi:hypothetical protein
MAIALKVETPSSSTNSTTLIEFLLDETGSMESCRDATISGFNEYVHGQKINNADNCLLSLTKFDSRGVNSVYMAKSILDVEDLNRNTYAPNSSTNLYDAIGFRIKALESFADANNILMVIMTDGYDNCSREYTAESVKAMIKEKEALGWSFVYMGANQDAWAVGQQFGMTVGNTMSYDTTNIKGAMGTLSAATTNYRNVRSMASTVGSEDNFFSNLPKE